jgi:hypothetical protein
MAHGKTLAAGLLTTEVSWLLLAIFLSPVEFIKYLCFDT